MRVYNFLCPNSSGSSDQLETICRREKRNANKEKSDDQRGHAEERVRESRRGGRDETRGGRDEQRAAHDDHRGPRDGDKRSTREEQRLARGEEKRGSRDDKRGSRGGGGGTDDHRAPHDGKRGVRDEARGGRDVQQGGWDGGERAAAAARDERRAARGDPAGENDTKPREESGPGKQKASGEEGSGGRPAREDGHEERGKGSDAVAAAASVTAAMGSWADEVDWADMTAPSKGEPMWGEKVKEPHGRGAHDTTAKSSKCRTSRSMSFPHLTFLTSLPDSSNDCAKFGPFGFVVWSPCVSMIRPLLHFPRVCFR